MKVIVPLAGPDFIRSDSTKAEYIYKGAPLLRYALESRFWWKENYVTDADLIFVLQNDHISRAFVDATLMQWYPNSSVIFLDSYTRGAAFSALAGISVLEDFEDEVLCIDLADIVFNVAESPTNLIQVKGFDALALTFKSNRPEYSYIRLDKDGNFQEAIEKKVISEYASAGVYFYKNASVYLKALGNIVSCSKDYTFNNLYYVCPVFNGVDECQKRVGVLPVTEVDDIKIAEGVF